MLQDARIEYDRYTLNSRVLLLVVAFYGVWFCVPFIFHFGLQTDIIYLQFVSFLMPLVVIGSVILLVYARLVRRTPIYWWIILLNLVLGIVLSWYSYNRLYDIVEKI